MPKKPFVLDYLYESMDSFFEREDGVLSILLNGHLQCIAVGFLFEATSWASFSHIF
jgi:hypothetical protein